MLGRKKNKKEEQTKPSVEQLENEIARERYKVRYNYALRTTIYIMLGVAAAAMVVATLWIPVIKVYGTSMVPTINEGDMVVAINLGSYKEGDIVALYYNNKILLKRIIACAGSEVMIEEDGTVYVDGEKLDEPYVKELALGQCDIEMPYTVPEDSYFVMGDNRASSADSRATVVGCILTDSMLGKVIFRVLPFNNMGFLS